jgi:hypothetical protein
MQADRKAGRLMEVDSTLGTPVEQVHEFAAPLLTAEALDNSP